MDELPTEVFLDSYPVPIRAAANELRAIVKRGVPDALEGVRTGWRIIGYSVPIAGGRRTRMFAGIGPEPKHCHLFLEYGAFLRDPEQLLEGAHLRLKQVRYLTFKSGEEVAAAPIAEIERLVREATVVAGMTREERYALAPVRLQGG
jgi:hypothetical protein